MSIDNRSQGSLFVHVPKAAGTSVTKLLSPYSQIGYVEVGGSPFGEAIAEPYRARLGISNHSTARQIRAIVGEDVWASSSTFALARNPCGRAHTRRLVHERYAADFSAVWLLSQDERGDGDGHGSE